MPSQTVLQLYCKTYKQAPVHETHGLLRKAMRLDRILEQQRLEEEQRQAQLPPQQQPNGTAGAPDAMVVDGGGSSTALADVKSAANIKANVPNGVNGHAHAHMHGQGHAPGTVGDDEHAAREPDPQCYRCRTEFSPFFHEVALGAAPGANGAGGAGASNGAGAGVGKARSWLCHKCYAETRMTSYPVIIGIAAAS